MNFILSEFAVTYLFNFLTCNNLIVTQKKKKKTVNKISQQKNTSL